MNPYISGANQHVPYDVGNAFLYRRGQLGGLCPRHRLVILHYCAPESPVHVRFGVLILNPIKALAEARLAAKLFAQPTVRRSFLNSIEDEAGFERYIVKTVARSEL